jgi:hypothetical protein
MHLRRDEPRLDLEKTKNIHEIFRFFFRFMRGLRLEGQVMFFDLSFFRRRVIS